MKSWMKRCFNEIVLIHVPSVLGVEHVSFALVIRTVENGRAGKLLEDRDCLGEDLKLK